MDFTEMQALIDQLPAGPWASGNGEFVHQAGSYMAICRVNEPVIADHQRGITVSAGPAARDAVKAFIAASRELVPALMAEVAQLRAVISEARRLVSRGWANDDSWAAFGDALTVLASAEQTFRPKEDADEHR